MNSADDQKFFCSKPDCTAVTTGTCLVGKPGPQECEYYGPIDLHGKTEDKGSEYTELLVEGRTFHAGCELGTSDTLKISRGSYAHFIGLMGPYNAGKTCFLLSLYLMASRELLPDGHVFKRSLTLQGFEDRAHKLREWKSGPLPERLADHTTSADDRRPGFLHLGILKNGERVDLLFSDLPGEWTTSLVKRAETALRWDFLKRADGIVLVLDGVELCGTERVVCVTTTTQLLRRLKDTLKIPTDMPLVILVAKADEIQMTLPAALEEVSKAAHELGFIPKVILCASFSRSPDVVANGVGVVEAVDHIIAETSTKSYIDWDDLRLDRDGGKTTPFRMFKHVQ